MLVAWSLMPETMRRPEHPVDERYCGARSTPSTARSFSVDVGVKRRGIGLALAALLALPGAALAQSMTGMAMPAPAAEPEPPEHRPEHQLPSSDTRAGHATTGHDASGQATSAPGRTAPGMTGPGVTGQGMTASGMTGPGMSSEGMAAMAGMDHGGPGHGDMTMVAALGPYATTREASGTAWQPDASPMPGVMRPAGAWTLMGQALLNGVYDRQSGRRGDDKAFVSGMIMGMATRTFGPRDTVQLRAMLSPDPVMGPRGYPLLLAAGETANGRDLLVDRQHPHDLFMELAASYSRRLGERGSAFVYFGLPGEPAFGPGAFMHRFSIMDLPEAPITHHWFDSTHITFGVVTAGVTSGAIKLEASRFNGREPDQNRYDIERPRFDSTAVRASWNPARTLALQASWMRLKSPEQLTPEQDQERWSASAIYTQPIAGSGYVSATAAWGRKREIAAGGPRGNDLDAYLLEAAVKPDWRWTVFVRAEQIETDELLPSPGDVHGPRYTVGKASVGVIRDFRIAPGLMFGFGGLVARSLTPGGLDPAYGGDRTSGMGFVRLKLG